ncbi:MAG: response regulator, partial [Mariprofundales bacterium]|nr:response regulator [Mariprofundales bacterium]
DYHTFVLSELVESLFTRLQPEAESRALSFNVDLDASVPAQLIGDSHRINQILHHLVDNAIKFTQQGEVHLKINFIPVDRSSGKGLDGEGVLEVRVKDSGVGIDGALRERLFQPFSLGDDSLTREHGGNGMGLAICHHLLQLMDGEVEVSSVVGKGSEFCVKIPLKTECCDDSECSGNGLVGQRVLVVDDSVINRQVVCDILSEWGVIVLEAEDGAQAIELLEREPCDLVLMDMLMPVMGGVEATAVIRQQERSAALPIIAMTGNSSESDREECLAAGMNGVLQKPIDFDELPQQLLSWLAVDATEALPENVQAEAGGVLSLLPAIADADRDHALRALGDSVKLYYQLLKHFPREHRDSPGELRQAMARHDLATAQRVAHTLKSSASSIGARLLMESAAQLESSLRAGELPPPAALQTLEERCAQLVSVIERQGVLVQEAPSPPASGRCDCSREFMQKVAELSAALSSGEERAMDMLEAVLPQLQQLDVAGAERVQRLVDGFDFVAAAEVLQQIMAGVESRGG